MCAGHWHLYIRIRFWNFADSLSSLDVAKIWHSPRSWCITMASSNIFNYIHRNYLLTKKKKMFFVFVCQAVIHITRLSADDHMLHEKSNVLTVNWTRRLNFLQCIFITTTTTETIKCGDDWSFVCPKLVLHKKHTTNILLLLPCVSHCSMQHHCMCLCGKMNVLIRRMWWS